VTALPLPLLNASNSLIGLLLAAWTLLFLVRIVLSWYPQLDSSNPLVALVLIPTEPLLAPTRKLIQPIGGVDVTPVIWVGLVSLMRELLVGQQGLISQLLRSATLFDIYRPQQAGASLQLGEKSLAVRLVLSSDEATLTEEQIEAAVKAVVARLQIELGARLRA
jgi:YggT family protein